MQDLRNTGDLYTVAISLTPFVQARLSAGSVQRRSLAVVAMRVLCSALHVFHWVIASTGQKNWQA